ncbi:helix-turn-helix domain-containing protein [Virgisporangium aurantiacum]|uniref:HTH cro/C1-type domain-containing protein n=1 Tax=Virgisporangium aurantiacum TaxID=175570 RepID=A0A8J3ZIF2_9ACTN|nr:helix-turn-helix transcriptional regulator [Virgisporangium aurantiacum]GIJ64396.1 hypothetical protein Vau01_119120 [Virgisporangium aurantiacum]
MTHHDASDHCQGEVSMVDDCAGASQQRAQRIETNSAEPLSGSGAEGVEPELDDDLLVSLVPTSGANQIAHRGTNGPTFEEVMKDLRRRKGLSYRQLARVVHYSHGFLWQLETGAKQASESVAAAIDRALDADGRLVELARLSHSSLKEKRLARLDTVIESASEDFVGIPVETEHGVVAYLVTRRSSLTGLPSALPALIAGQSLTLPPAAREDGDIGVEIASPAGEVLNERPVEWSSFLTVTRLLASQRQAIAPEVLLSLVEAHRACLARLLSKANSDPLRFEIALLLGETSIVASRLWSAKGNRSMAVASCAYARQLADRMNAPMLGATARIFESNLHSEAATLIGTDGNVLLGLRMLDEAACMEQHLTPAARARIAAEQAQTYAVLGLRGECERALVRARDAAERIGESDRHGLFSDWNPSRLQVYEGTCALFLGNAGEAAETLTQAVREAESDPENVNVRLAAQVDLGSAYAESGHLDQGCRVIGATYAQLLERGSRRGIQRALCARQRLRRWNQEDCVRDLDAQIESATVGRDRGEQSID